jgi:hypothetical protein
LENINKAPFFAFSFFLPRCSLPFLPYEILAFFFKVLPTKAVVMVFRTDERAARKPKQPPTDFGTGDRGYSTSQVSL